MDRIYHGKNFVFFTRAKDGKKKGIELYLKSISFNGKIKVL